MLQGSKPDTIQVTIVIVTKGKHLNLNLPLRSNVAIVRHLLQAQRHWNVLHAHDGTGWLSARRHLLPRWNVVRRGPWCRPLLRPPNLHSNCTDLIGLIILFQTLFNSFPRSSTQLCEEPRVSTGNRPECTTTILLWTSPTPWIHNNRFHLGSKQIWNYI